MKRTTRNQTKKSEDLQGELDNLYKSAINFKPTHSPSKGNPLLEFDSENEELNSTLINADHSVVETRSDPTQAANLDFPQSDSTPILSRQSSSEPYRSEKDNNIIINSSLKEKFITMSAQTITLKDALKVVPEFDGHNIPLSQFLEGCTEANNLIDPESERNLTKLIKSRLKGEARAALSGQNYETIEQFKNALKDFYAPSESVQQLLGNLGSEFQRDNESVLAFANRIRDLGNKILEARRVETGVSADSGFKSNTESNVIDCFKRGLKPEVSQRITEIRDTAGIIKAAIKIERDLQIQKSLREKPRNDIVIYKKRTNACQICNSDEHEADACEIRNPIICRYCKKSGHTIEVCKARERVNSRCQLCDKAGHLASQCPTIEKCQLCNKIGHTARTCNTNNRQLVVCQICGISGHSALNCYRNPNRQNNTNKTLLTCQNCGKNGHTAATCYIRPNQNHKTNQNTNALPTCFYCKEEGHMIANCERRLRKSQGNGQSLQGQSAPKETTVNNEKRSINYTMTDEQLLSELLP